MQLRSLGLPFATVLLVSLLGGSGSMAAQSFPAAGVSAPAPRVLGDWRSSAGVAIARSKPSRDPAAIDLGPAPANQVFGRMLLLLAPAPAQQQALAAELASLQNPSSPSYHHWLTPQAFARSYANNPSDVAAVASWLESQSFRVAPLPAGSGWIEFSGTVAQVEQAFGAQVDMVSVFGNTRAVITANITVPDALSPVIAGLVSLDGVLSTPALTAPQPLAISATALASLTSPVDAAAFTPRLVAELLNLRPLAVQGVSGAGQTIAIVSRSNVNSADVAAFRSAFALPASPLQISLNGTDPGLANDQAEATVAASWAGAAAPGAQILLAPAATTAATDGVDLSLAAVIDQDLATVIAVGYSACESALSPAHQAFYSALYQQAAAEGITVIVAAGDGGAAACTKAGGIVPVSTGFAVNALASTPWNIAVGVVAYGTSGVAGGSSALTAWSPVNAADPAYASGGGRSTLYARKTWQPIPAELGTGSAAANHRLLPDLALPTALDSSTNLGLAFCLSGSAAASGCTLMRSGGSGVATAFFAGVAALINQKNGVQGNLAPSLYAASRAFNDVAQGTAKLACVPGSSGCDVSGLIGYAAGSGYDLATGLGVPDVEKLVTELAKPLVTGATPTITLSVSPVQANHIYNPSALVTFTATVIDPTASGIPTGTANLYDTTNYDVLTPNFPLTSSGSATKGSSANIGPLQLSSLYNYSGPQTYKLGGHYSGDSTYPGPDSGYLLTVTAALSPTILTITPSTTSPALGSNVTFTVTLGIAASGPPAGSVPPSGAVTLTVNGTALNPVALSTTGGVTSAVFTVPITTTSNSVVASYAGDSNYSAATTTSSPLHINVQGFTLTASSSNPPTNLNLSKGAAGSESFVIGSVGGYTGLVQVICTVPTQDDMTCTVSPQQVTPTATVTFVVRTYVTGGPLYASLSKPSCPGPLWPQAAGGAMLAGALFFLLPFGRRARFFLGQVPRRLIVLLLLLAGLAATGIGCSSPSTTVTDIGTPLGVATLQVTATAYVNNAVVAQTLNFTVNVQPQ
ncbi:MAG: protease pro-enzyme activation domain-containing protein [Terracidiphilus sp.]|nr:protease pro-enzyme activation domain-containing protein [Terracidiphilus sp.]